MSSIITEVLHLLEEQMKCGRDLCSALLSELILDSRRHSLRPHFQQWQQVSQLKRNSLLILIIRFIYYLNHKDMSGDDWSLSKWIKTGSCFPIHIAGECERGEMQTLAQLCGRNRLCILRQQNGLILYLVWKKSIYCKKSIYRPALHCRQDSLFPFVWSILFFFWVPVVSLAMFLF